MPLQQFWAQHPRATITAADLGLAHAAWDPDTEVLILHPRLTAAQVDQTLARLFPSDDAPEAAGDVSPPPTPEQRPTGPASSPPR